MYNEIKKQYFEIFQGIATHFGCESKDIVIENQFGEGKSGDIVLLVCIIKALPLSDCGYYVLKIFTGDSGLEEIAKTHAANQHPKGGHILIPELRHFDYSPTYYLYDMAGDDFSMASSLSKMDMYPAGLRLETLSTYLLSEWNEYYQLRQATLCSLISEWTGTARLENGSRLSERIRQQITDELADSFSFEGKTYPNPLFYLLDSNSPLTKGKACLQCALYGKIHGDLNLDNVIAMRCSGDAGYQFYLIDFDHYREGVPLLFDHAYLLLCFLLRDATGATLAEWCESLEYMFDVLCNSKQTLRSTKAPHIYIRAHVDAVTQFINHQQEHNRDSVMRQLLAAHVAVGLNFVNKRSSGDRTQKLALLYSATAMRALLSTLANVPAGRQNPPELQIGREDNSLLWRQVEHFSPENRYMLLTSGDKSTVSADQLISLAPISWTMVLEINHLLDNPIRDQALPVYKRTNGYRVYELPMQIHREFESSPSWIHLYIPDEQKNPGLYYDRHIQEEFRRLLKAILSIRENETLFIIADFSRINSDIRKALLNDILVQAGENTPIRIISLGNISMEQYSDEMLECFTSENSLADLSQTVYQLRKHLYDPSEISIPHKDGIRRISPEMAANLANDMVLVYRNIIYGAKDDNGDGFFHGNEATWIDLANRRDIIRLDYSEKWKQYLTTTLEHVSSGAGIVVNLFHRAGGGGTTLAKRIAWDFCNIYPTVMLHTLSHQTAERLKELYSETIKPILVIAEVSNGQITQDGISALRRELISKGIRVVFLFVSRFIGKERNNISNNLYLPDTPELYMADDEATEMLKHFSNCLQNSISLVEDTDDFARRIAELNKLTYDAEYTEQRQPFFYGLYTYENNFYGITEYVEHNSGDLNGAQQDTFNILAMVTAFSQSVNLSFEETALFLFPDEEQPSRRVEEVKDWMYGNDLVVRRDRGIRICHPIIAKEILRKNDMIHMIRETSGAEDKWEGTDKLVKLACMFVDRMVGYYGVKSLRVNNICHDIFTHRAMIYEDEQNKFSALLTILYTRERCDEILSHVANTIPWNPHYWNHLARLYLYPVTPEQKGVFPEPDTALAYAHRAIKCAKNSDKEGLSIHYHVLGKAHTKQCISILRKSLSKAAPSQALKISRNSYINACNSFDKCIAHDKSGYGLTGKLELITNVLNAIKGRRRSISMILTQNPNVANDISQMMSEAGDLINRYVNQFDTSSAAFRSACLKFYSTIGNVEQLELIFSAHAVSQGELIARNRAISAVLMEQGIRSDKSFSYDHIPQSAKQRIFDLMSRNIAAMNANEQDRIRWLEMYRRLPDFALDHTYQFLMEWPRAENNIYVCYYRYVIAFLIYSTTGDVSYDEVRQHLNQAESLSRNAYGKNVTTSLNYYGAGEKAAELLIPWRTLDVEEEKEDRIEQNKEYRSTLCKQIYGRIVDIGDNLITISFHIGNETRNFFAKSPNIYPISLADEGKQVKLFIGFSYSGMRAWDVVLDDSSDQSDLE